MSRNTEKAASSLNRFLHLKRREAGVLESNPNLRPKFVQRESSLPQSEKWRSTIISEISVKLTRIQDPTLNDYQIRDINDSINKLLNEKRAWEYRIRELGGPDYISYKKDFSNMGRLGDINAVGLVINDYRYFGRAKDLPDVREAILAKEKQDHATKSKREREEQREKSIDDLTKRIQPSYYYLDDGEELLIDIKKFSVEHLIDQVNDALGGKAIESVDDMNENYVRATTSPNDLVEVKKRDGQGSERKQRHEQSPKSIEQGIIQDFEKEVPSSEEVSKWLIEKRRKEIKNRIILQS